MTNSIPIGDIRLYDNYVPALEAGNWYIEVDHTLVHNSSPVNTDNLKATQEFIVSAPQFSLDPSEVIQQYPPNGSTGRYGEVLANIVLKNPMLPWERAMTDTTHHQPWLALLVLQEGEFVGGTNSPTHTMTTTVGQFLAAENKVLKPSVIKEDDIPNSKTCTYIEIPTAVFQAVTPRLHELRYLAHCRQINTGDKAILGLNEQGLFSVVAANRFPASTSTQPVKNIVHLVSLEGLDAYLIDSPNFGTYDSVALVSLVSWTFQSLPDHKEDFRGLLEAIVSAEFDGTHYHPANLWLRLSVPTLNTGDVTTRAEVTKRIQDGFTPIEYHTRTGENTFAWYRGPLTPLLTTPLVKTGAFLTADSALIYDNVYGVFDVSLASAWEIGRAVALSDKAFGKKLLDLRRQTHRITDQLLHRLQSDHFSASQIASLSHETIVQDEFIRVLDRQLLVDIGANPNANPSLNPPQSTGTDSNPKTAVQNFLADPTIQQKLLDLVQVDLDPIANWLARLLLLYPLPFKYLVGDDRMLPVESLRFFYLDNNWLGALLDGALSIGMESSRQTFFYEVTHGFIHQAAFETAKFIRDHLRGVDPSPAEANKNIMSGMLLRSAVVAGWPNLAVRPYLSNGTILKTLRMDHLSPNVLLCVFWGVPDYVEISEPQEGFRFGIDDTGHVPLRNLIPPTHQGAPVLGEQLTSAQPFQIRDLTHTQPLYMRSATSRVLNINPDSPNALIQKLEAALNVAMSTTLSRFGPADFALQMVKSPEAIKFNSQTS